MTIRLATAADRSALIALGLHFAQSEIYRAWLTDATEASVALIVDLMLSLGDRACIALAEDDAGPFGLLCCYQTPNNITGVEFCDELVWWVEPTRRGLRAGPALLAFAEGWAKSRGLHLIKVVAPIGTRVGRYYDRRGYRPVETAYVKML